VIYGQVSAGDSPLTGWRVQLAHLGDGETRSAELFWNGAFEFHRVPSGEHRLRVLDGVWVLGCIAVALVVLGADRAFA